MDVAIRLFGPVTIVVDGDERPVTGPRQRAVLARLALDPHVAVSTDVLLDDVWGDDLPSGGAKAVAFQINKLRGLFDPDRHDRGSTIVTDSAGYRFAVDAERIDIHRFDRLVNDARAALDDPVKARMLAEDALGMARGAPFADVDEQTWVTGAIERLATLRALAERTIVHARLEEGDHAEVVPDLERMIRQHPLEESLVADLMAAYDASGRTADALRAYGDLRRRLSHELGIEPSAELQRLEGRLLERTGDDPTSPPGGADAIGNLPRRSTSFLGREPELEQIEQAFGSDQVVVLTGPGGTGKTRLAVEFGRRRQSMTDTAVWMVELAPVSDPKLVMDTIGSVFGLRPGEGASIEDVVTRYLRTRSMLLIVDNCEHVLADAADAVDTIVNAAPEVRVLVTSRESLGLDGERRLAVTPLPVDGDDPTGDRTRHGAAIDLFIDRARGVLPPDHSFDDDELDAIHHICERVDGMPLGIELAAAHMRTMSVTELSSRLDDSLRTIPATSKRRTERQQTLHGAVDWSYSLLTDTEQLTFRRLSVFPTSFDRPAAEAVNADLDSTTLLESLDALVDKSLVEVHRTPAGTRYRLLVPIREHAHETLAASGEADEIALRHAHHYRAFASHAGPFLRGHDQADWDRRVDTELDHIRRAIATFTANGAIDEVLGVCFDLLVYWVHRGLQVEANEYLSAALDTDEGAIERRLQGYWALAILGAEIADTRCVGHAQRGLELARTTDDPDLIGRMELSVGAAIRHSTTDESYHEHLVEGRRLLEEHTGARTWWEPTWERAMVNLLLAAYLPTDDARQAEHFETAIDTFHDVGDRVFEAAAISDSIVMTLQDEPERAAADAGRACEMLAPLDLPYWYGHALQNRGAVAVTLGDHPGGLRHLSQAAGMLLDCGDLTCWAASTRGSADCEVAIGDLDPATAHVLEVIEVLPHVPLVEIHLPRVLDTGAHLLYRMGDHERAAEALVNARRAPFPVSTLMPRGDLLQMLVEAVDDVLGAGSVDALDRELPERDVPASVEWLRRQLS